jgi:membrane protease YdiL (CAAX protease family)
MRPDPGRELRIFLRVAFGITWGIGLLGLLLSRFGPAWAAGSFSAGSHLFRLAVYGPSLAAVLLTFVSLDGLACVRWERFGRLRPRKADAPWIAALLLGLPILGILAGRLGDACDSWAACSPEWGSFFLGIVAALFDDPGPLGEEFGWRGYALPRLLQLRTPLQAALISSLIWAVWHAPALFIGTLPQSQLAKPAFVLEIVALGMISAWLYIRTGSLLLPILLHLMVNYCESHLRVSFAGFMVLLVLVGIAASIALARMDSAYALPDARRN